MSLRGTSALDDHPAWPRLTKDQRKAVNEVWNDLVVPALEDVERMRRERDAALLEAQTVRDQHKDSHRPIDAA